MRLILTILLIGLFKADAQMVINASSPYRPFAMAGNLLLDSFPGGVTVYSLRKLRTSYTGAAIRVRKDTTGQPEQDIGFIGNELDTVALKSFLNARSGFVVTWYDQSGNARNATQSTQANQPRIALLGTINRMTGKPSIYFNGSSHSLTEAGGETSLGAQSIVYIFIYAKSDTTILGNRWIYNNLTNVSNTRFGIGANLTANRFSIAARRLDNQATATIATFGTNHDEVQKLITAYANYGSGEIGIYSNGSGLVTNTLPSTGTTGGNGNGGFIGSGNGTAQFFVGQISEIIIYTSNQSSNRAAIETNINNFYGIY